MKSEDTTVVLVRIRTHENFDLDILQARIYPSCGGKKETGNRGDDKTWKCFRSRGEGCTGYQVQDFPMILVRCYRDLQLNMPHPIQMVARSFPEAS